MRSLNFLQDCCDFSPAPINVSFAKNSSKDRRNDGISNPIFDLNVSLESVERSKLTLMNN